ncbi:hypothetical protein DHBDCA_p1375 [Dehalobacter sp. DCA]|jgi:hypothetical protein|uniref:hypothetical protein n=1 Tax=Dehalobacter sp. DCA TaxID=1147129 RepID=UPI00028A6DF9|nr:hypothetical protein [Dehalobacter sp. DCA]AFV02404.1 hypothetical protein DHBDCA_p1375 [Dehalobacter sp. DCA]
MNYFEQELRRLFGNDANITDKKFVGRAFFGKLTDNLRVRVEFVTLGTADHYEAIKATIINRNDGPVDALALRLSDLVGKKMVSNPNFKDGIAPYIWKYGDKIEWYVYKPTKEDYDQISGALNDYFNVFREPTQEMEQSGQNESGLTIQCM